MDAVMCLEITEKIVFLVRKLGDNSANWNWNDGSQNIRKGDEYFSANFESVPIYFDVLSLKYFQ